MALVADAPVVDTSPGGVKEQETGQFVLWKEESGSSAYTNICASFASSSVNTSLTNSWVKTSFVNS